MTVTTKHFGTTKDGQEVKLFTIGNGKFDVEVINFGAAIKAIRTTDLSGFTVDTVLGFDTLAEYEVNNPYLGVTVGRYANRIADGSFKVEGKEFKLAVNNGPNALHGGLQGFSHKVWLAEVVGERSVEMTYISADGEEGYPGNLTVKVKFTVTGDNALEITYKAETDQPTVINLTNHSYFNLDGEGSILDHIVKINSDKFLPTDDTNIPTGELRPVDGTPFDFRNPTAIGAKINEADEQLKVGNGYDHNYIIDGNLNEFQAEAWSEKSGIKLEMSTTEPGVQLYTGNYLQNTPGKGGAVYADRTGFCFETQHWPDSPNRPEFPSTELQPGKPFKSTTIYRFTTLES